MIATAVSLISVGFAIASGWIAWAREHAKRVRADAQSERYSETVAEQRERLSLYAIQVARYSKQVRELLEDDATCGDPDAVRDSLNRMLAGEDTDGASSVADTVPGAGPDPGAPIDQLR